MPISIKTLKDDVVQYTLQNGSITAKIINLGATLTHLIVPDRNGNPRDIVLGCDCHQPPQHHLNTLYPPSFDDPSNYMGPHNRYLGATVGRVANRIARGAFTLNDTSYSLAINNGPNALHGGLEGFDRRLWTVQTDEDGCDPRLVCTLHSDDGDQGYPGALHVRVTFTLQPDTLAIEYHAALEPSGTLDTIINLTNHSYFNLSGGLDADVLSHTVQMHAEHVLPKDETSIPTGEVAPVVMHPAFDFFSAPRAIGARMPDDTGYDHCYVVAGIDTHQPISSTRPLRQAVRVHCDTTGIALDMRTTEPGFQFYTGYYLDGEVKGKHTQPPEFRHAPLAALCLEAQRFPDAVNQAAWRHMVVLQPGQTYTQRTEYTMSVTED